MNFRGSRTSRSFLRDLILQYRRLLIIGVQMGLIAIANHAAFLLRFDGHVPDWALVSYWQMLPWLVAVRGLSFIPFRLYEGLWRYSSVWDLRNIVAGVATSSLLFYVLTRSYFGAIAYPRSVFVVDPLLLIVFLGGIRLLPRVYRQLRWVRRGKRVLIFGAGDAGEMIVREIQHDAAYGREPIGFVDDDPVKVGQRIHGVPVLGTRDDLPDIMVRHRPLEVLVAIPHANAATMRSVVRTLERYKVPITTLPNLRDLVAGKVAVSEIRSLSLEDLLTRAPVGLDPAPIRRLIAGKRVLVTGAGGSIGAELCRQITQFEPASLVLYERYEPSLYNIASELVDRGFSHVVKPVIGDVTDRTRLSAVLGEERPHIIFHAAAHKHVPMMELNACEAVKNNVTGVWRTAAAAERYGVERFILISSDKAVNPSSVMGATKRVAELIVQGVGTTSRTTFIAVRFGNVLGTSGSVIPRFLEQIKAGGPVTVTDAAVRRYFMLVSEAVQLVLQAAAMGERGLVYVLEMGEQIRVLDLARSVIRLSGFVPGEEIPITFIGLRPGEKLFEALIGAEETLEPSAVEKILRVRNGLPIGMSGLSGPISELEWWATYGDSKAVIEKLREIVPTFTPGAEVGPSPDREIAPTFTLGPEWGPLPDVGPVA